MNFNTLSPSAKILKKQESYLSGHPVTDKEVPHIAVICAFDGFSGKGLLQNVLAGIRTSNAAAFVHNVPYFGIVNRVNPMTAKYAPSFYNTFASNAKAIVTTNMIDGVVIITDCPVTAGGLLHGCLEANCPAVVLPFGQYNAKPGGFVLSVSSLSIAGRISTGELTSVDAEEVLKNLGPVMDPGSSFFGLLETLGLTVKGASSNKRLSGAQLVAAIETGRYAVEMAKDIRTLRKILDKKTWERITEGTVCSLGLYYISKLFDANNVKTSLQNISGTAIGNGFSQPFVGSEEGAGDFSGKAWVYHDLEEADNALLSGGIPPKSVVVIKNCVGIDVSGFAYSVMSMNRASEIAIITDGVCDTTGVLAVTMVSPNSYDNREFANIQNGDMIDINTTKGRCNTNILSKEMKTREKRNPVRKQAFFF